MTALADHVADYRRRCRQSLAYALALTGAGMLLAGSQYLYRGVSISLPWSAVGYRHLVLALAVLLIGLLISQWLSYARCKRVLAEHAKTDARLKTALRAPVLRMLQTTLASARQIAERNPLVQATLEQRQAALSSHLERLLKADLRERLHEECLALEEQCEHRLAHLRSEVPVVKAQAQIRASIDLLEVRRRDIALQWEQACDEFSWWNKLKYAGTEPDFSEMDKVLEELRRMDARLKEKHQGDLEALDAHLHALRDTALSRIAASKVAADKFVDDCGGQDDLSKDLLKKAFWLSALSIPVSVWADLDRANGIYDALRGVNGNFSQLSDAEIWWETLFMPADSLVGLASLTKGAYFEQLVAGGTGGRLFEHFNNPDTDIVIDGVAYQLKATDSADYVSSVADGIPVIATSEVAG